MLFGGLMGLRNCKAAHGLDREREGAGGEGRGPMGPNHIGPCGPPQGGALALTEEETGGQREVTQP